MNNQVNIPEIERWLISKRQEITADLISLVRCPSFRQSPAPGMPFGPGCQTALVTFLGMAERMGFTTQYHDGYCGSVYYGQGPWELGLVAHLDVVEAGEGWTYGPFAATKSGDFVIGRGTQDNKGGAIGALYAMKYFLDHGIQPGKRLHLLAGCNEESGMADIRYYLEHEPAPDFSLITDCGFPVCCGEKGHLTFELILTADPGTILELQGGNAINSVADVCGITLSAGLPAKSHSDNFFDPVNEIPAAAGIRLMASGKSAHAACPDQGINAIALLFADLERRFCFAGTLQHTFEIIQKVAEDTKGDFLGISCADAPSGALTISAGTIRLQDGKIVLDLDIRYPVTRNGQEIAAQLASFCADNQADIRILDDSPPYYLDQQDPKVQYLTRVFNDLAGTAMQPYTMGGGTHARLMPNALGYGISVPGTPTLFPKGRGLYHQPDEALHIPSLLEGIKIYIAAITGMEI